MPEQDMPVAIGAVVEATDGFVGTVAAVVREPGSDRVQSLVIQNEDQTKQFTLPVDLIANQSGTRVVHLSISRAELTDSSTNTIMDSRTANIGHPTPPFEGDRMA